MLEDTLWEQMARFAKEQAERLRSSRHKRLNNGELITLATDSKNLDTRISACKILLDREMGEVLRKQLTFLLTTLMVLKVQESMEKVLKLQDELLKGMNIPPLRK